MYTVGNFGGFVFLKYNEHYYKTVTDIHACTDLNKLYNVSSTSFIVLFRTGDISGYTMGPQVGLLIFKMQNTRNIYHEEVNQTTRKSSSEEREAEKEEKGKAEGGGKEDRKKDRNGMGK